MTVDAKAASAPSAEPAAPAVQIEPHLLTPERRIKLPDAPAQETSEGQAEAKESQEGGDGAEGGSAEPTTEEPKKPDLTDPRLQEQFQTLARRSKALRDREDAIKKETAELERLRKMEERLKAKDYSVAQEYGLSLDEWSEKWLQEQGEEVNPVTQKLREQEKIIAELREWKQSQEQQRESEETRKAREEVERARADFKAQIDERLAKSDEFKVLTAAGLQQEVFNVIDAHAARTRQEFGTPHILEVEEAAQYVQKYWVPKLKETFRALAELPDFSDVLEELTKAKAATDGNGPDGSGAEAPTQENHGQRARPATALTNEQAATAPPRSMESDRPLSRDEKIRAAASKLQFVG